MIARLSRRVIVRRLTGVESMAKQTVLMRVARNFFHPSSYWPAQTKTVSLFFKRLLLIFLLASGKPSVCTFHVA